MPSRSVCDPVADAFARRFERIQRMEAIAQKHKSYLKPINTTNIKTPSQKGMNHKIREAAKPLLKDQSKVYCDSPQMLEEHKDGTKRQNNTRGCEKLLQSGQIVTSQLNMASGVIVDSSKKEIQLPNNVEIISEVPDGKTMDNFDTRGQGLKRKKEGGIGGKYPIFNVCSEPVVIVGPGEAKSYYCKLCDIKCDLLCDYRIHVKGKKHSNKLKDARDKIFNDCSEPVVIERPEKAKYYYCNSDIKSDMLCDYQIHVEGEKEKHSNKLKDACDQQVLLGAGKQPVSGGDNKSKKLSKPVELSKPAEIVSFTCELCNFKCASQAAYLLHMKGKKHQKNHYRAALRAVGASFRCESCNVQCVSRSHYKNHVNGKRHLHRLKLARHHQYLFQEGRQTASGELLGLQTHRPPDINALTSAINSKIQQGDTNSPQVLLGKLVRTVLSKTQVPATELVAGARSTEIPAPSSMAGLSTESQLLQSQVSEITAPLESNAQPGSSISTHIDGGNSEAKQQV
ncbi:hypothetical protein VNO78_25500 [Psophocarpus tetragonolobus]|uniref:C2H2-type domain-containing protein n=1 Tax=Psophocarpus tetragonolobus TaxID=3891 RepID=A0AAN9S713_PSOTE